MTSGALPSRASAAPSAGGVGSAAWTGASAASWPGVSISTTPWASSAAEVASTNAAAVSSRRSSSASEKQNSANAPNPLSSPRSIRSSSSAPRCAWVNVAITVAMIGNGASRPLSLRAQPAGDSGQRQHQRHRARRPQRQVPATAA